MSYRTEIEGVQIFGNNEYYQEYADFLISQGIEIDEEGCYEGEITDVQGLFRVIDRITKRLLYVYSLQKKSLNILNGC